MLSEALIWGRMKKGHNKIITCHSLPKEAGKEETALKNEKIVTLILDRGRNFKSVGQWAGSYKNKYGLGS